MQVGLRYYTYTMHTIHNIYVCITFLHLHICVSTLINQLIGIGACAKIKFTNSEYQFSLTVYLKPIIDICEVSGSTVYNSGFQRACGVSFFVFFESLNWIVPTSCNGQTTAHWTIPFSSSSSPILLTAWTGVNFPDASNGQYLIPSSIPVDCVTRKMTF